MPPTITTIVEKSRIRHETLRAVTSWMREAYFENKSWSEDQLQREAAWQIGTSTGLSEHKLG